MDVWLSLWLFYLFSSHQCSNQRSKIRMAVLNRSLHIKYMVAQQEKNPAGWADMHLNTVFFSSFFFSFSTSVIWNKHRKKGKSSFSVTFRTLQVISKETLNYESRSHLRCCFVLVRTIFHFTFTKSLFNA